MKTKIVLLTMVLVLSSTFGAVADGFLIVEPHEVPEVITTEILPKPQFLSVKYHRVTVRIEDGVAHTIVDQVFQNSHDIDLEGTYLFPLPEDAAISEFSMYAGGKRMSGKILEREKARAIYEEIVRKMKDPGLLEYYGRNLYRARVYPIPARSETRIQLEYRQIMTYDAGVYRYVYPLSTERFSPQLLQEITITAEIKSSVPIKSIYSPSHDVDLEVKEYSAKLGYEATDVRPDRDFVLYYSSSTTQIGLNLLSYRTAGEPGYFLMMLSPGNLEVKALPKDIIFIFDTSGSMRGEKIRHEKDALRFCITHLGKEDRFNIIQFATTVNSYSTSLVPVNEETVDEALSFIDSFTARGGTNINDALVRGVVMLDGADSVWADPVRMVVFLTDGEPTVGQTKMSTILKNVTLTNSGKARIFVFGVGHDVNTHLLDRLASQHRGISEYLAPDEEIDVRVSGFYRKINEPILSEPHLDFGRIHVSDLYPAQLPDLFRGTQLLLAGRYQNGGEASITLSGHINGEEKRLHYTGRFKSEEEENDFLPRLWATRKIGYLMSEIRFGGEDEELVDEVIQLSKEYGIITPYTSFLILEKDADFEHWGISQSAAPEMRSEGERYRSAIRETIGEEAVSAAADIISMKTSNVVRDSHIPAVKHAHDKTFYLRDGIWVDGKYREGMKMERIAYLSKRFFRLLETEPELARYLAVAKNIIVVVGTHCYRITE